MKFPLGLVSIFRNLLSYIQNSHKQQSVACEIQEQTGLLIQSPNFQKVFEGIIKSTSSKHTMSNQSKKKKKNTNEQRFCVL